MPAQSPGLRGVSVSGVSRDGRRRRHRSGMLAVAAAPLDRRGRGGCGACGGDGAVIGRVDLPRGTRVAHARRERMTAAAINARGLGKDFGAVQALDRLDLEVREGEFFGFLGPNGAGKTTTVHLLATLLAPSRGSARVVGHDIRSDGLAVRRGIGLVFQETTLDRDLTIDENLRFAARLWNLPEHQAAARIEAALRRFGLFERRRDSVRSLSGAMRRAADIARGILHEPRIL